MQAKLGQPNLLLSTAGGFLEGVGYDYIVLKAFAALLLRQGP